MALADEVRDPWTVVAAGLAGGMAWAVGIPVGLALGVGVAVAGVKAITGALSGPRRPSVGDDELPVKQGSMADGYLRRAVRAQGALRTTAATMQRGAVNQSALAVAATVDDSVARLRRLAGQVCAMEDTIGQVDERVLDSEEQRLRQQLAWAQSAGQSGSEDVAAEVRQALESLAEERAVLVRLRSVRNRLLAQLQSGAIGLEALAVQLSEVSAHLRTSRAAGVSGELDELAATLEGLRSGLVEAEAASTGVLAQIPEGLASPHSVPGSGTIGSAPPAAPGEAEQRGQ